MGNWSRLTMLDIAIIGGGLSGLALANTLHAAKRDIAVFEANQRFGGRILSVAENSTHSPQANHEESFKYDLGPGWIWPEMQPRLAAFITQHRLGTYSQWDKGKSLYQTSRESAAQAYDDNAYAMACRIEGGAEKLIEVLIHQLPSTLLNLNYHLVSMTRHENHVELRFGNKTSVITVKARRVVLTIPPRLILATVDFKPGLEQRLSEVMSITSTWMAGHAKAVIRYAHAFWREAGLSGNALASYQGAALAEIFDACSPDGQHAALAGFFALPAALRNSYRDDLEALITEQLVRLFGKQAAHTEEIIIHDWFNERLTSCAADEIPPNYHPQYGDSLLLQGYWDDKLYFGGTETATQFGGYLEGALEAAERVANSLLR